MSDPGGADGEGERVALAVEGQVDGEAAEVAGCAGCDLGADVGEATLAGAAVEFGGSGHGAPPSGTRATRGWCHGSHRS